MSRTSPSVRSGVGWGKVSMLILATAFIRETKALEVQQQVNNDIAGGRLIYASNRNVYAISSLIDPVPVELGRGFTSSFFGHSSLHFHQIPLTSVTCDAHHNVTLWSNDEFPVKGPVVASFNGSITDVVESGQITSRGIEFDWVAGNLYILTEDSIVVCGRGINLCSVLMVLPHSTRGTIALHPNKGIMFWTQSNNKAMIMRAGLDGTLPHALVSENLGSPIGISIDESPDQNGTERMYWIDSKLDRVESSKLDGSDRKTISSTGYSQATWIGVFRDRLFWADRNSIRSFNKLTGEDRKVHFQLQKTSELLRDVEICHKENQPVQRSNPCVSASCSHICTLSPTMGFRCVCPVGMLLNTDKKTCIESPTAFKLFMSDKNKVRFLRFGSIGRDVLESITFPELRSITAHTYNPINHTLIMSDGILKKIYQYSFYEKKLEILVYRTQDKVTAMDIDVVGGNLYWIDAGIFGLNVMSLWTRARTKLALPLFSKQEADILVVYELSSLFISWSGFLGGIYKIPLLGKINGHQLEVFQNPGEGAVSITYGKINDANSKTIWWIDRQSGKIGSAYINGTLLTPTIISNFTTLLKAPLSDAVFNEDKVYWRDGCTQELIVTSLKSANQLQSNSTCSFGTNARMTIFNRNTSDLQELLDNHECSRRNPNRKRCSHICLITGNEYEGDCRCPEGLILNANGLTCDEEMDKPSPCLSTQFECRNGHCIRMSFTCDGTPDCHEDEDEAESLCKKPNMGGSNRIANDKPDEDTGELSFKTIIIVFFLILAAFVFVYFGGVHLYNKYEFDSRRNGHANPFYGRCSSRETQNL